jgi:hypothetical protein
MWDHLPVEALIEQFVPPYGLAPGKWREQVIEIRNLPEIEEEEST